MSDRPDPSSQSPDPRHAIGHQAHYATQAEPLSPEEIGKAIARVKASPDANPLVKVTFKDVDNDLVTVAGRVVGTKATQISVQLESFATGKFDHLPTLFGKNANALYGLVVVLSENRREEASLERLIGIFSKVGSVEPDTGRMSSVQAEEIAKQLVLNTQANVDIAKIATEAAHAKLMSLSMHSANVERISRTVKAIREAYLDLFLPPTGGDRSSLGYTTVAFVGHMDDVYEASERIMELQGDDPRLERDREDLCVKLQGRPAARPWILQWIQTGVLTNVIAFWLGVEVVMVDRKLPAVFREKAMIAATAHTNANADAEEWAYKHKVKSTKKATKGLFFSFSEIAPLKHQQGDVYHSAKGKNKWSRGTAPAPAVRVPMASPLPLHGPHRVMAGSAVPTKKGGGGLQNATSGGGASIPPKTTTKPFYKDMQPGALIHDWIVNLVGLATLATFESTANLIFPNAIRKVLEGDVFDLNSGECLAPLLVKGDHWVLLHVRPDEIAIYDSLRTHTSGDARLFALELVKKVPALKNARVRDVTAWQQQDFGSNDCGLFAVRAVLHIVGKVSRDACNKEFTREFLDGVLPRYVGTQTSVRDQGAVPSAMRHDFINKIRHHFGKAPIPLPPLPAAVSLVPQAGVPPSSIPPTTCTWGCQHGVACGAPVKHTHGVQCSQCKAKFCGKHASTWHTKSTWKCPSCRPAWQTKGHGLDPADYSMPPDTDPGADRPDFRSGQENPHLANKQGSLVPQLIIALTKASMHPLAMKGVTEQTRTEHQSLLARLAKAPQYTLRWPAARIALEVIEIGRKEGKWCWGTVANKTGLMAAALNRLPEYTKGAMDPLILRFEQEWTDAGRHIRRLAHQTASTGLPGVSETHLMTALETAPNPSIKALLILTWATVARCGDTSQVKTAGLEISPPNAGSTMTRISVFFERGKVIGKIDPYHIVTEIPEKWAAWLREWHQSLNTVFLFQQSSKAQRAKFMATVREHLRTINPEYDLRGVRRGAAQTMAEQGASMTDIMYYTRHVDVAMLRRYLRYGKANSEETRKGAKAASKLWSGSC